MLREDALVYEPEGAIGVVPRHARCAEDPGAICVIGAPLAALLEAALAGDGAFDHLEVGRLDAALAADRAAHNADHVHE